MRILATDMDRTLLPNGEWPADREAIPLFNRLTRENDTFLVYVTGRNLDLAEEAIHAYGLRFPDILCADVGTTVFRYEQEQWLPDTDWSQQVYRSSPRWDAKAIAATVTGIDGLREQETVHLNQFKQSYYVEHGKKESIFREIVARVQGRFDEEIIYSFDPQEERGLLDFLPDSANKRTVLEYVANKFTASRKEVVFCGDSGNDILALTAGFSGVVVKNADQQLIAAVQSAMQKNPRLRIYFAKGDFMNLNGNYTSGVIEGCFHYGLFRQRT